RIQLRLRAAPDRRRLGAGLEAVEAVAIAPAQRAAQSDAGLHGGVMDLGDQHLVFRVALAIAREIAEIAARREDGADPGDLRDLARVLHAFQRLDHDDQDDVVVEGRAITSGHVAPNLRGALAAARAAPAHRREVGPLDHFLGLL